MEVFRIRGGESLEGTVKTSGSKNAALPLFAAALLSREETVLENVPDLSDIRFMAEILTELGAEIERLDQTSWKINPRSIVHHAPYDLVRKMRASVCLLGPLTARLRRAEIPMPGGCVIGNRPIDLHLRAMERLGANAELKAASFRSKPRTERKLDFHGRTARKHRHGTANASWQQPLPRKDNHRQCGL